VYGYRFIVLLLLLLLFLLLLAYHHHHHHIYLFIIIIIIFIYFLFLSSYSLLSLIFEIFDLMLSDWVSFLAYPNLFGIKGFVVVVELCMDTISLILVLFVLLCYHLQILVKCSLVYIFCKYVHASLVVL
jgi:hypothetical protein